MLAKIPHHPGKTELVSPSFALLKTLNYNHCVLYCVPHKPGGRVYTTFAIDIVAVIFDGFGAEVEFACNFLAAQTLTK